MDGSKGTGRRVATLFVQQTHASDDSRGFTFRPYEKTAIPKRGGGGDVEWEEWFTGTRKR